MTNASDPSRVINLSQRLDAAHPTRHVGELLGGVRNLAGKRLQQWIGNVFERVDDTLFDLAEKAESNAAQMHYFDGMRDVRKRRPAMERDFLGAVSRALSELSSPRQPTPATSGPAAVAGPAELSLVADNELEESLAITSMTSKHESRLARDLFAVNQRLSVICGGNKIDDATNPVAPALLAQAFRDAMRELNADMRVKLIVYKLFDRYVLSSLEELYQDINNELARAGVLPQLRHQVPRRSTDSSTGGAAAAPKSPGTAAPEETASAGGVATAEVNEELLATLHSLFSARRSPPGTAAGSALPTGSLPSANELLGALSVLQSQIPAAGTLPPGEAGEVLDAARLSTEVLQLKQQLLSQVGALRGEKATQVAGMDEDTIDLVGMLFEFILEDRNLPVPMQVMLARLQIPYLKVAILDRKLFAHNQHPARRLLDLLAELAKGWSPESDRDHRLHDKVKSVVDRLLHDFDDDLDVFSRLLADLQQFQETNKRRSELAEQRAAESAHGREKLERARRAAAREILDRIGERKLPPLLHGVLARAWANHLVLTVLRHGEKSPEFRCALRFVDEFIASTLPVNTEAEKATLRQMLPGIERALRQGLANVAFQEQDINKLLLQLRAYYRRQLGEPAQPEDAALAAKAATAPLPIPESVQPIITPEARPVDDIVEELTETAPPDGPEWQLVQGLQPGTWLEFRLPGRPMERAKLSWISPMSGRYLFVNRRGLKVADFSPQELAVLITEGKSSVLASNPLIDRALTAIVDKLSQPEPPTPPTL